MKRMKKNIVLYYVNGILEAILYASVIPFTHLILHFNANAGYFAIVYAIVSFMRGVACIKKPESRLDVITGVAMLFGAAFCIVCSYAILTTF